MIKPKSPLLFEIIKSWLPLAAGLTIICLTAFILVQQAIRLSANERPAQIAYDAQLALYSGKDAAAIVEKNPVELSGSRAPFLMVFDESEKLVFSSATVYGKLPVLPDGVLAYTREHNENRITWQPSPGVRAALVIVHMADGGFTAGGQSLAEPEKLTGTIQLLAGLGWAAAMGATLILTVFFAWLSEKRKAPSQ